MKVVFLGTPSFGVPALQKLAQEHEVVGVVCQPDKPSAHGKIEYCEVKKFALSHNLPVFQFEKISRDGVETLKSLAPDVMVTAAYGQILSQEVIDIAPHGILNIHGSLLPLLRGAAPIQYSVLLGHKTAGVTILKTVYKVDAGDMLLQKSVEVLPYETSGELYERISHLGADAICQALAMLADGTAVFTSQDESLVTFSHKLTEQDEHIDWSKTSTELINLVRALAPDPGATVYFDGVQYKIYALRPCDKIFVGTAGQIVERTKKTLAVMCGDGKAVFVTELQMQGKKRMDTPSFLNGNKTLQEGVILQ